MVLRRRIITADEQDVHTRWRRIYCWTKRASATVKVKRRSNRREGRTQCRNAAEDS